MSEGDLESRSPIARIAFARIRALTLSGTQIPREALEAAMQVGTRIEWYGRVWRMGPWHREGPSIVGRIGYQSVGMAELWNEAIQDFTEAAPPLGLTSPFAIEPEEMRIAFQVRGSQIKVTSFTAAFQRLLNHAQQTDEWQVVPEVVETTFPQWVARVDRVTYLHASLQRPNPHYGKRGRVEELIETTRARAAEIVLRSDPDNLVGIDVGARIVQEAVEHVDHDYGSLQAIGEVEGEETHWNSRGQRSIEIRKTLADPQTSDVSHNALRLELGDPEADLEQRADAQAAIDSIGREIEEIDFFADEPEQ
jgi:hypothetical protein